jgi:hypothetical protein
LHNPSFFGRQRENTVAGYSFSKERIQEAKIKIIYKNEGKVLVYWLKVKIQ